MIISFIIVADHYHMDLKFMELFQTAIKLENRGHLEKSMECYKSIIRENRDHFESWLNLGSLYLKTGKSRKALICFQSCLKIRPDYRSNYNIALIFYRAGEFGQAAEYFRTASTLKPDFLTAYLVGAYSYSEQKEHKKAITLLETATKYIQDNESLLVYLAVAYFTGKETDKSLEILKKIDILNPDNKYARKLKIKISLENEITKESLQSFRDFMTSDQTIKEIDSIMNQPENLEKLKTISQKKKDLITKKDKSKEDYLNLSLTSFFMGNSNAAIGFLEKISSELSA